MRRHIPNLLTAGRVVLAVGVFLLLLAPDVPWHATALVLFVIAAATDAIDGYLARRLGAATTFGRIADPAADKILVCGVLVILLDDETLAAATGLAPWMTALVVARELAMMSLRGILETRGTPFGARWLGKAKALVQFIACALLLARPLYFAEGRIDLFLKILLPAMVALTLISCVPYLRRGK